MLFWGFILFRLIFGKRIRKQQEKIPTEEQESTGAPTEPLPVPPPKPKPYPLHHGDGDSYDYKELREKILKSWGVEKGEKPKEMDLPDEMEQGVYTEDTIHGPGQAGVPPVPNRFQEYVSRSEKKKYDIKERGLPAVAQNKESKEDETDRWTEDNARKWIVYDAVFGEPRSRRCWSPFIGRK